ncbi:MAG: MBL fold metallo-hydrolase [Bacteroidales bacterium]|nr:MBL fold metallo-hydrolase [Bacteroidales bacterium]
MNNKYNIVVLSDNRSVDESLESEHGLCVLLKTGKHRILLDTGASGLFIRNAQRLGIDIKEIDYVFISHGHNDHIGGLVPFLEINTKAKILLSKKTLNQHFFSNRNGMKDIGIDFDHEKYKERCLFVEGETHLEDGICIFSCSTPSFLRPKANHTLFKDSGNGLEPDDFDHELVFCYGVEDLFVYTGCAHRGVLNILDSVRQVAGKAPEVVFGGFHLLDDRAEQVFETESEILRIGECLKDGYPKTLFLTGHCTGTHTFEGLKHQLDQQIELFYTGFSTQL